MPTRLIREGLLDSDKIASVDDECAMLFVRLMLLADDFGRFDGRPSYLQVRAYPVHKDAREDDPHRQVRPTDGEIRRRLGLLEQAGLIRQYVAEGKPFLEILNFNQRMRAKTSKFPDPPDTLSEKVRVTAPLGETQDGEGIRLTPPPADEPVKPNNPRNAELKAIAITLIDYLNAVAGTQYKTVDGTLQWPMQRLRDGATEAELRAVIDAKQKEVRAGLFDPRYMRPETLFNKTKFNSYVGQLHIGAVGPPEKRMIIRCWKDGEIPTQEYESTVRGPVVAEDLARAWLGRSVSYVRGIGYRHISVQVGEDQPAVFSIEELKR